MLRLRSKHIGYYASIIVIILFWGCSVEQTHKTLTFFFDGVDKVIFFNSYLSTDSISKDAIARREGLLKKVRPDLCVHQPFREKKCEKCHTPDKRLLMPMPALCYQCHKNFAETYANVHGPVASGNCVKCHNQHSSKYAKLLTRQGQQVCTFCHAPSMVFANKVHRDIEDAECTLCHNPHGGKNRFMVKNNIPRDANRIALMSELTSRHLYGQIFCKEPGDISNTTEIKIYDNDGILIATAHPDDSGKFMLSNMHPDQNYTFRIKNNMPDCKINVIDSKGTLLYVIEKKKGKYLFDKTAYEAAHEVVNSRQEGTAYLENVPVVVNADHSAHRDTVVKQQINVVDNVAEVSNNAEKPEVHKPADTTQEIADVKADKEQNDGNASDGGTDGKRTTVSSTGAASKFTATAAHKGKIRLAALPEKETAEEIAQRKKNAGKDKAAVINTDTTAMRKSKIVVKTLPGTVASGGNTMRRQDAKQGEEKAQGTSVDTPVYKGKIVVKPLPAGASESRTTENQGRVSNIRQYEQDHITLLDLSSQINNLYEGTTVCVLNDSGNILDIAPVSRKGQFMLFDFLSYSVSMPDSASGIVSQTIFLNEKREVIEVVNRRISGGRYVYVPNSREPAGRKANIRLTTHGEAVSLFTTIYYDEGQSEISATAGAELDKVVQYLKAHPDAKTYLAAHTDTRGSLTYNLRLSNARARSAEEYLLEHGIAKGRILTKGYGKAKPLENYALMVGLEEMLRKNRRVEIYIKDR